MYYKKVPVSDMLIVPNLVGYVLGDNSHIMAVGEQFSEKPDYAWICHNLETAKNILAAGRDTYNCYCSPNRRIYNVIYRVHADNISGVWVDKKLFSTNQADKIIVDQIVHYEENKSPFNADDMMRQISKLKQHGILRQVKTRGK